MIAVDTNVMVRLMVEDDVAQVRHARQLLDEAAERDESVLVDDIVLCELEWVLESAYKVPRERILSAIQAVVGDDRFCFEDAFRVAAAMKQYQRGRGDLSDYLLGIRARGVGAGTTFTFDRGLRGEEGFTVVG
jgi:predicted nucleic-acid-binding protein